MMISLIYLIYKKMPEEDQANIGNIIPFASEYVDDGFSRGAVDETLKFFQEKFHLAEEYNLRNVTIFFIFLLETISIEILVPFKLWGLRIDAIYNIQILKNPIYRS